MTGYCLHRMPVHSGIDSAVRIERPYDGALKTTLYRHVVVLLSLSLFVHFSLYIGIHICEHDASPFHVAAVPLAGNCHGDRSSSSTSVHRRTRRFKWVAQTAPSWYFIRARQNWFKPHYTWIYTYLSRCEISVRALCVSLCVLLVSSDTYTARSHGQARWRNEDSWREIVAYCWRAMFGAVIMRFVRNGFNARFVRDILGT